MPSRFRCGAAAAALLGVVSASPMLSVPAASAATPLGPGFVVSGGPPHAVAVPAGTSTVVDYTVVNTSARPENITVRATGLSFSGDAPQFSGPPSPGLSVSPTPAAMGVPAGESHDVQVQVSVAPGVSPGGLSAGVIFSDVPPPEAGKVTVVAAQARPLLVHVGPASGWTDTGRITSLTQPDQSSLTFDTGFFDTGNVDYQVAGSASLLAGSAVLATVSLPARLVLPGGTRTFPVAFAPPDATSPAPTRAVVHLTWGLTGEHHGDATTTATYVPAAPSGAGPGEQTGSGIPPSYINRPPSATPAPPRPAPSGHAPASGRHRSVFGVAAMVDLLLILMALILLIAYVWRRRREDHDREVGIAVP